MVRNFYAVAAAVFLLGAGYLTCRAALPEVPVNVQIPILLKILSYDRNLERHGAGKLVVGVVYNPGSDDSKKVKDEVVSALDADKKLRGLDLQVEFLPFKSVDQLTRDVEEKSVGVMILGPDLGDYLQQILGVTKWKKISTLAVLPEYVEEGAAAGVELAGKHPRIVINLEAAKAQGCDLPAQLLTVARVIR